MMAQNQKSSKKAETPMFNKSVLYLFLLLLAIFLIIFALRQGSLQWVFNNTALVKPQP